VTVTVHQVPESEEFEGGYAAVTMRGVPHGVIVTGEDPGSAERALNHLLDGLRAFGFSGRVVVDDVTFGGGVRRQEIDLAD